MSELPGVQWAVRAVPGVVRAQVAWPDPHGPARLDIAIDPGADQAQATAGILQALERAGVDVSTLDLDAADVYGDGHGRPVFAGLTVERSERDTVVAVTLDVDGRTVTGRAEGLASHQQTTRTTAAATLAALRVVAPPGTRLQLEWLEVVEPHGQRPGVVHVAVTTLAHDEHLDIGSAFVRGDLQEATVRATLDAVNRRLGARDRRTATASARHSLRTALWADGARSGPTT